MNEYSFRGAVLSKLPGFAFVIALVAVTGVLLHRAIPANTFGTFHTQNLIVDNQASIGTNVLDDNAGALRLSNATPQLQLFQPSYSNPVTAVGGLVPGSDLNVLLPNFGTKQGQGTSYNKFPVGFNGQTAPLYTIDILSDEPNVTNTDWKIRIGWAGSSSFDTGTGCVVSPTNDGLSCEGAGIYSQANLTHGTGTAPLYAVGVHARATISGAIGADKIYSVWAEEGAVRLDTATTIGLPTARVALTVNTDASVYQGTTTTAQAAATGTLIDLRQGAAHNYVGFSNPDATDAGIVVNNVTNSGDGYFIYRRSTGWQVGTQNGTTATITNTGTSILGSFSFANTKAILSSGTPSANHGSLSARATDFSGRVTAIGANTSVVLTYSAAFGNGSECTATPLDHSVSPQYIEVAAIAASATFSCFAIATQAAANCDPFTYNCVGN